MDNREKTVDICGYRAPALAVLASVHQRTLAQDKVAGMSDGLFLLGVGPIRNASI